jgi:hypothetical protein
MRKFANGAHAALPHSVHIARTMTLTLRIAPMKLRDQANLPLCIILNGFNKITP